MVGWCAWSSNLSELVRWHAMRPRLRTWLLGVKNPCAPFLPEGFHSTGRQWGLCRAVCMQICGLILFRRQNITVWSGRFWSRKGQITVCHIVTEMIHAVMIHRTQPRNFCFCCPSDADSKNAFLFSWMHWNLVDFVATYWEKMSKFDKWWRVHHCARCIMKICPEWPKFQHCCWWGNAGVQKGLWVNLQEVWQDGPSAFFLPTSC